MKDGFSGVGNIGRGVGSGSAYMIAVPYIITEYFTKVYHNGTII